MGRYVPQRVPVIPYLLWMNLSNSGVSWTWHIGRFVAWNSRTKRTSVNLPGPVNWRSRGRRR